MKLTALFEVLTISGLFGVIVAWGAIADALI